MYFINSLWESILLKQLAAFFFLYFVRNEPECSVLHLHDIKSDRYFLREQFKCENTFGLGLKDIRKFFLADAKRIQRKVVDNKVGMTTRRYIVKKINGSYITNA